jgi:hypothetical protein
MRQWPPRAASLLTFEEVQCAADERHRATQLASQSPRLFEKPQKSPQIAMFSASAQLARA